MAKQSEFVTYLVEILAPLGSVHARAMFGGYGIYLEGTMFGLVADDVFYLKINDDIETHFSALGLPRFRYQKKGKWFDMSYCQAPESALEDSEEMAEWALRSYQVALKAKQK